MATAIVILNMTHDKMNLALKQIKLKSLLPETY